MARQFNGSDQFLLSTAGSVPITGPPLTLVGWGKSTNTTDLQVLLGLGESGAANNGFAIQFRGDVVNDPVAAGAISGGSQSSALSTTSYQSGVWHHLAGVFVSATERIVYLDGGGKATQTASRTPTGINRVGVGAHGWFGATSRITGCGAECAVYNVALNDAEVLMLSLGVSPLLVRPESLVAYWPLIGRYSPETDEVSALGLTVTGATNAAHPRIIYPRRAKVWQPPAAVVAGSLRRLLLLGAG